MFSTIKQAKLAGFRSRKAWEYGGEEITVQGRFLVRNPKEALSKTEWSRSGFRICKGARPPCRRAVESSEMGWIEYHVYREDQVEPKRRVCPKPPREIDILAALWVLNRRAKRCRDIARKSYWGGKYGTSTNAKAEKNEIYSLKGQVLHYLLVEGRIQSVGYHWFHDDNWAEVLKGDGYVFHRPCPPQRSQITKQIDDIEAKPRGRKEPRLKDALHTVKVYLAAKPHVRVFKWPKKRHPTPRKQTSLQYRRDFTESDDFTADEDDHDKFWE